MDNSAALSATFRNSLALWLEWGLHCNGNGPINNLDTAIGVLEHDPNLRNLVWYDEFLQKTMTPNANGHAREWTSADEINLTLYMQRNLEIRRLSLETVSQACKAIAVRHRRHSVRDWLHQLPAWDGIDRIDRFFEDHFGAEPSTYTSRCSRNFWLMLIARVMVPGCQVDNMIVLEGPQGIRKSQAMRIVGGEWFTEQHEKVTSKAFFEVLQGKMLVEIGEMDAFTGADVTRVKAVVSCTSDRYREPYERHAQDHPRQCVFVGSTNRNDWNKDETGVRRFWPIRCSGQIDIEAIAANRDQNFAEAVARFKSGESWWEMPVEETSFQQTNRYAEPAWVEPIKRYLEYEHITCGVSTRWDPRSEPLTDVSIAEILEHALEMPKAQWTKATEMRVAESLRFLDMRKKDMKKDGKTGKRWIRVAAEKATIEGSGNQ